MLHWSRLFLPSWAVLWPFYTSKLLRTGYLLTRTAVISVKYCRMWYPFYNIITAQTGTEAAKWNSLIGLLSQGDAVPDNKHNSWNPRSTIALPINRIFLSNGKSTWVELDGIFQVDSLFANKCYSGWLKPFTDLGWIQLMFSALKRGTSFFLTNQRMSILAFQHEKFKTWKKHSILDFSLILFLYFESHFISLLWKELFYFISIPYKSFLFYSRESKLFQRDFFFSLFPQACSGALLAFSNGFGVWT